MKSCLHISMLFLLSMVLCAPATAKNRVVIPVPKNVIYAGQVITASLLGTRLVPTDYLARVSVFTVPSEIAGKVARTTLMPNRPIPTNFVVEPDVVQVNRKTVMRFENGSLRIVAEVVPLNNAKAGEPVRARNISSGVIVYGYAQKDGSIDAGTSK